MREPNQTGRRHSVLAYVAVALMALIVMLLTAILLRTCNKSTTTNVNLDASAEDYTGDRPAYAGKKNTDTIDIPGYGSITLQAGVTEQAVSLHNPEENSCYFRMSLLLADRTELWKSDLVEPGKAVYQITLNAPLEAGTYEGAILKYECFAMDEGLTPLNGSEIALDLIVLE